MKKSLKLTLLRIVENNGNLMLATKQGYELNQILSFIKELIEEGFIKRSGNKIEITNKGRNEIDNINNDLERFNIDRWIDPEYSSKIPKISENDVFLPNQNELFFD